MLLRLVDRKPRIRRKLPHLLLRLVDRKLRRKKKLLLKLNVNRLHKSRQLVIKKTT